MGISFVRFQGAGYLTRDNDLELWLRFLSDAVELVPEPPGWLAGMAAGDLPRGLAALGLVHRALDAVRDEQMLDMALDVGSRLTKAAREALG